MFVTVKAVKMKTLGVVLKQLLRKEISEELEEEEEALVKLSIDLKERKVRRRKESEVQERACINNVYHRPNVYQDK